MVKTVKNMLLTVKRWMDKHEHRYYYFLQQHPLVVLTLVGTLSFTLTGFGVVGILVGWSEGVTLDAKMGFETRGTKWSDRMFAWQQIRAKGIPTMATDPNLNGDRSSGKRSRRHARAEHTEGNQLCKQLDGKPNEDNLVHLVQAVFKFESLSDLFTVEAMRTLCEFQAMLRPELDKFNGKTPYQFAWSLPNYALCLSAKQDCRANCSQLQTSDIKNFERLLTTCLKYRSAIIHCSQNVNSNGCRKVPQNCSNMPSNIIYRLLSLPNEEADTVFVNTLLPIYTYEVYRMHAFNVDVRWYEDIYARTMDFARLKNIDLRGLKLGIKAEIFGAALLGDLRFGVVAFAVVGLCIALYCRSVVYTLAIICCLLFSLGNAYFVYTWVFGIRFFPFVNLLVLVLLVGIGADDTFVINHLFNEALREEKKQMTVEADGSRKYVIQLETIQHAFSHAALSMLVTSLTTGAAFYANLISNVMVLKCFGIFAGTTMLINFCLAVTWLPASLLLIHSTQIRFGVEWPKCNCWTWLVEISSVVFYQQLPRAIVKLRWVLIPLFAWLIGTSAVIVFHYPGFKLPATNPIQLFKSSHPYEWYDEHAQGLFPFLSVAQRQPINVQVIWGIRPIDDASYFNPSDRGRLHLDRSFRIDTVATLRQLGNVCHNLKHLESVETLANGSDCWPQSFIKWSNNTQDCTSANATADGVCCNVYDPLFQNQHLPICLRRARREQESIFGDYKNPTSRVYFDNNTVIAFRLGLTTRFHDTMVYEELKKFHEKLEADIDTVLKGTSLENGWFVAEQHVPVMWYDLLLNLLEGTPISIASSTAVALAVVVLTTKTLLLSCLSIVTIVGVVLSTTASMILLGWSINVVESTILVLTVGLSFDFTLHYAVTYKLSDATLDRKRRIQACFRAIGGPVLLSALTTALSGLAMNPSTTQAFYQLGLFMCLVTGLSWFYASLFFVALLAVMTGENKRAGNISNEGTTICDNIQQDVTSPSIRAIHYRATTHD